MQGNAVMKNERRYISSMIEVRRRPKIYLHLYEGCGAEATFCVMVAEEQRICWRSEYNYPLLKENIVAFTSGLGYRPTTFSVTKRFNYFTHNIKQL
jgi:hypothetical protein